MAGANPKLFGRQSINKSPLDDILRYSIGEFKPAHDNLIKSPDITRPSLSTNMVDNEVAAIFNRKSFQTNLLTHNNHEDTKLPQGLSRQSRNLGTQPSPPPDDPENIRYKNISNMAENYGKSTDMRQLKSRLGTKAKRLKMFVSPELETKLERKYRS